MTAINPHSFFDHTQRIAKVVSATINIGLNASGYRNARVLPAIWSNQKDGAHIMFAYGSVDDHDRPIFPAMLVAENIRKVQNELFGGASDKGKPPAI